MHPVACDSLLVYDNIGEILVEELLGTLKLLLSVLFHFAELVVPAHRFPLMYAKAVVGEYLDTLYLFVLAKGFAKSTDILFHIAIIRYEDITKPEGVVVLFEPSSSAKGLLVAAACELAMTLGVELLDIEQHEVYLAEEFLDMLVPYTTISVDAGVYTMTLEVAYKGHKGFGLYRRFATREGDTTTLAIEGLLANSHVYNIFGTSSFATLERNRVGVGTIKATEGTTL